ncbi:MAG: ATP-binding cassette, subfamily bacterial, partial [Actinomycetota bacterium]|nr:ATP-binding cassette, subfamily bacterial [Actinomycetota bacterium]
MSTADPGWLRRLGGYMLRHRRDVFLSLGAALLGGVCQTAAPLVVRQIVDGVILSHHSSLWPWLLLLVALGAATFAFAYVRRYRGGRVALAVQYDLRNAMHDHLCAMDATQLAAMPTGQLVGRASSDSTLVQGLLNFFPIMSSNVLLVVLSVAVMLVLSPVLAIVSLIVVPAVLVISYRMRWRVFPATWDGQQREGDVVQIVDEDLSGVRVVKAFAREERELERVADASVTLYGSQMRAVRLQARFQPLLEAVPALGQVAILAFGGWLALRGRISLGTFLAFSSYVTQLVAPAQRLAGILTIGQQARAGVERIFQLLDLEPAITDAPDAVELPRGPGRIDFNDVTFAYRSGAPVLSGFDLHLAAGERVALVGPSGSGKSTAALLVSRFYDPDEGAVLVDGHDVRSVTRHSLRSQVGVVFEESFLFSQSVRDNIAYGRPEAADAEIEAAARAAGAHEFIERLPRGYDTVVGERGLTLSGGQRQRVALARALLTDPRILVLDDATSAVDARTEEAIHDALREMTAGRTTLLVAHRRSTLGLADRIVVLDDGHVVDEGTHEALLERCPLYRTLLTGLEDGPGQGGHGVGDQIEALAGIAAGTTTAAAWAGERKAGRDDRASRVGTVSLGAPSIGPGLGGGGGNWRANLAPTPEILARVAALPPVRDVPDVDLDRESRPDRRFSLPRLLAQFRAPLLVGLLLVVLDALASLAGPVLVKTGVDNGVRAGSQGVLFAASAIYLLVTFADLFDQIGETFVTGRAAQRIMLSLRIRIWAQIQRLSLDYYESEMAGRIMTRMTTDVDQFESLIENGLLSALVSLVTFVGVGVALVALNPELGLCTLGVVVPLAFATVVFRRRAATLYDEARERIAIVNADFQESLSGVREAQAFVHEDETMHRFHHLGKRYLDSRVSAQRLVAIYFPFVQFVATVANAVVLGVGAHLIAAGHLTTGALIAFILYIDLFFSPIQQLSQVFDSWQQTRVSVARIAELMTIETRTPPAAAPVTPGRLRGDLTLEAVRFTYPTGPNRAGGDAGRSGSERRGPADRRMLRSADAVPVRPPLALEGLSLRIAAGETVALVGETGAGKSTVMKLLARFYDPDEGLVQIDGLDVRSLDLAAYRRQLGYVPQEAFLFTGTVRDNIAYGRPGATDAEVEAAARAVGAHPFIAAMPGGYLHDLDERGRSLSAGQRQLIALARAELVDPAVLLLDEATSNLDLSTEA